MYDTPYEPEGQSADSDSESTVSLRLRESKLPQDDDRPADEYDQPWEWNRVTIPALAGRSSVPAREAVALGTTAVNRRQVGPARPGKHRLSWAVLFLIGTTKGILREFLRGKRPGQREAPAWQ